ncbi:MAG TPA: hypothetical protein VN370_12970 [Desulfitobacteriaceae bacterium]|nr:hypothetical protein [Desulfitobacteriaceae bacterium]
MTEILKLGFGPYTPYLYNNGNLNNQLNVITPGCNLLPCPRKAQPVWLLIPAGIGTAIAFLIGFNSDYPDGFDLILCRKGISGIIIYTAFTTMTLSLYVFYILNEHLDNLSTSFLPLSIGIGALLLYYGAAYFLLFRLDPDSFEGFIGDDLTTQFLTFIYYSITTFATSQDGDIKARSLAAKGLVSMESLFFICIFTLGIVLFSNSK